MWGILVIQREYWYIKPCISLLHTAPAKKSQHAPDWHNSLTNVTTSRIVITILVEVLCSQHTIRGNTAVEANPTYKNYNAV